MLGLRLGLAAAALASLGVFMACGSSNSASLYGAGGDSGEDGSADAGCFPPECDGGTSSGSSSGGGVHDSGSDAASAPTSAVFVHASPSLLDLRLCWSSTGDASKDTALPFPSGAPMPASNYPGIPVGGAATLPDASTLLGGALTIWAIDAHALAEQEQLDQVDHPCSDRLGNGPYAVASAYVHKIAVSGGIQSGATNVLAIAGCPFADPDGSVQRCGPGWTSAGNLHVDVLPFQGATTSGPGQLAVRAAQLSPALQAFVGDGGAAVVSFGLAPDGGARTAVAKLGAESQLLPMAPVLLTVGTALPVFGQLGFAVDVPRFDGGAGHLWMSLAQSLSLVDPMQDPAKYYGQATTYVVAVIGDPNAPPPFAGGEAGAYDGTGLHVLVLPAPQPVP